MTPNLSKLAVEEVIKSWSSVPERLRPDAMWITSHLPVADANDMIDTDVDAAWFFDGKEAAARQPSDYVRFIAVHSGGFWHSGMFPPSAPIFQGQRHEIGVAHFCSIEGREDELFIETIFGGRSGKGVVYRVEAGRLVAGEMTWVS